MKFCWKDSFIKLKYCHYKIQKLNYDEIVLHDDHLMFISETSPVDYILIFRKFVKVCLFESLCL